MPNVREILRLHIMEHMSFNAVAASVGCHHETVKRIIGRAEKAGLSWPLPENMDESSLEVALYPEGNQTIPKRPEPDMEYIDREMHKRGVTLSLLWDEYRRTYPFGLGYTQFCERYRKYIGSRKITMHIEHKAGEKMYVDWAGATLWLTDRKTGEQQPVYLFITAVGTSGYPYCRGYLHKSKESWIDGHRRALEHYGAVPLILVPDNDKSGVTNPSNYDPELNRTYQEFAEHYGVAVIPARVRRPQDKAKVEHTVRDVETWIIGALRNRTFFDLPELNAAIAEKLDDFSNKPFQKKDGSRRSLFLEHDLSAMRPLPATRYEYADWRTARVNSDYHVEVEKQYYSVHFSYAHQEVDIRVTFSTVEIFSKGVRICSHKKLTGRQRQYSTDIGHMPENHRKYITTSRQKFEQWAETVGSNTVEMVRRIFGRVAVEEQGIRSCYGLKRIHKQYGTARFEEACNTALGLQSYGSSYVERLLRSGYDLQQPKPEKVILHGNIRGADYYSSIGKEVNVNAEQTNGRQALKA